MSFFAAGAKKFPSLHYVLHDIFFQRIVKNIEGEAKYLMPYEELFVQSITGVRHIHKRKPIAVVKNNTSSIFLPFQPFFFYVCIAAKYLHPCCMFIPVGGNQKIPFVESAFSGSVDEFKEEKAELSWKSIMSFVENPDLKDIFHKRSNLGPRYLQQCKTIWESWKKHFGLKNVKYIQIQMLPCLIDGAPTLSGSPSSDVFGLNVGGFLNVDVSGGKKCPIQLGQAVKVEPG